MLNHIITDGQLLYGMELQTERPSKRLTSMFSHKFFNCPSVMEFRSSVWQFSDMCAYVPTNMNVWELSPTNFSDWLATYQLDGRFPWFSVFFVDYRLGLGYHFGRHNKTNLQKIIKSTNEKKYTKAKSLVSLNHTSIPVASALLNRLKRQVN